MVDLNQRANHPRIGRFYGQEKRPSVLKSTRSSGYGSLHPLVGSVGLETTAPYIILRTHINTYIISYYKQQGRNRTSKGWDGTIIRL